MVNGVTVVIFRYNFDILGTVCGNSLRNLRKCGNILGNKYVIFGQLGTN